MFWQPTPFGNYRYQLGEEFNAYRNFLRALGVKESPTAEDAIAVLLEISNAFGQSNLRLDEETEQVVWACWRMLNNALKEKQISSDEIRKRLYDSKTVPDNRHILEPPPNLILEDRADLGQKLELVKNNLIKMREGTTQALEAAGVQRMSKLVQRDLVECLNQKEDDTILARLAERKSLLSRIQAKFPNLEFDFSLIDQITYMSADQIKVIHSLRFHHHRDSWQAYANTFYQEKTLYFVAENGCYPWMEIALELWNAVFPSDEIETLALVLDKILSLRTLQEAKKALDILGYPPPLETFDDSLPQTPVIADFGGESVLSETISYKENALDKPLREETPHVKSDDKNSLDKKNLSEPREVKRTRSTSRSHARLISYVYPEDQSPQDKEGQEIHKRLKEIEKEGIQLVIEFEKKANRNPQDMNEVSLNFPGYDILSIDECGDERYIEVKALSGSWSRSDPVRLTRNEFETARKEQEKYWLYIVENIESTKPKIHCIRNPAGQVDYYLFDHGWIAIADHVD